MTAKPHGRDCPDRCSICLGVKPKIVDQLGPLVTVDGSPVRPIAPATDPHIQQPRKRQRGKR